jgi:hypothetical protein
MPFSVTFLGSGKEKRLKILKFDILRVPSIQIPPKKGKNLEFCSANFTVEQMMPIFGNYFGVREPEKRLKILKFDILRVPSIQIPPKKGKNLEFCTANFTVEQMMPIFGNYFGVREPETRLKILKFDILRVPSIQLSFLASSKIFIFNEVMDICMHFFFQILATLNIHNFFGNYQITNFLVFSCSFGCFHDFLFKNIEKKIGEFLEPPKNGKIVIFVIFLQFLKTFFSNIPG